MGTTRATKPRPMSVNPVPRDEGAMIWVGERQYVTRGNMVRVREHRTIAIIQMGNWNHRGAQYSDSPPPSARQAERQTAPYVTVRRPPSSVMAENMCYACQRLGRDTNHLHFNCPFWRDSRRENQL